ncbi:MAG: atfA2 [Moraxellaceae bacterium]|nr:atfA2 [Moraxellaceae bacterium]
MTRPIAVPDAVPPARKLSLIDTGWLLMETPESPMHVGSLQLYELPADAGPDYLANLYEAMVQGDAFCAPFNRKLQKSLGGLEAAWVRDDGMDIEYHVRHSALPRPGRVRELLALVSRLHAHRLDRRRPMWECHLIEGLEGNRFAVYVKMHHSLVDGVAGSRLLQSRLSPLPLERPVAPWSAAWEQGREARRQEARVLPSVGEELKSLGRSVRQIVAMAKLPLAGNARAIYQAPRTQLNQHITGARRFAAQSWSLARIKAVGAKHGATVNDVFLAMCAGCLRDYLISLDALPAEPLVAQVPVALRSVDQADEGGNAITTMQVSLGTHLAEPLARLTAIRDSVQVAKTRLGNMTALDIFNLTALTNLPLTLGQVTGISGRTPRPLFNLVISNVPGPCQPLHLGNAKLLANYPVSLIWHGYAVNITVQSYCDNLDVGIIACRNTVPRVQRMLDHLETALAELEQAPATAEPVADTGIVPILR